MNRVKIVSDGTNLGTKISVDGKEIEARKMQITLDADTGEDVEVVLWMSRGQIDLEIDGVVHVTANDRQ